MLMNSLKGCIGKDIKHCHAVAVPITLKKLTMKTIIKHPFTIHHSCLDMALYKIDAVRKVL